MKNWKGMVVVGAAAALVFAAGCEEKTNPVTQATDAAKSAGSKVADGAKDVAAATKEGVKDAGHAVTEGAKDLKDAAATGLEDLKAAGTKWVSDAESKWPAMKTELEGYTKKVAEIKDVNVKTKAEGLVKDLQTEVPAIEKMVTEIKEFKTGDLQGLMDKAKKSWDSFSTKLGELKKLIPA